MSIYFFEKPARNLEPLSFVSFPFFLQGLIFSSHLTSFHCWQPLWVSPIVKRICSRERPSAWNTEEITTLLCSEESAWELVCAQTSALHWKGSLLRRAEHRCLTNPSTDFTTRGQVQSPRFLALVPTWTSSCPLLQPSLASWP